MHKPNYVLKAVYDARPLRRDREQYLDDSMFRESPFHSLRLQNTRHSTPFRGRALANLENTLFANEMRNMRGKEHLPLTDLAGQSLRGQFVFPAHAYSFNPSPHTIGGSTAPDLPMNLKTGLPLNLFGFKGKTPQRYGKNIQEEGIIYGDLNEEDVMQLNTNPLRHDDIREAGRALLPTHHGRLSGRARADKIEEAMRVLMEAEIPPALYNQEMLDIENIHNADNPNLTTPGYMGSYLQPFRQWEQGEGYRVRDLDRQEELGLISPEQRMLMDDNLGQIDPSGNIYRSEPMEIAMRLLKEAAYGSRDEPPTMTRLMQGNYAEKPDACTLCGNSPVVAGAQFRNPLGSINYTHHLCEPCADQYDIMHSADMYKSEPMDIAFHLLKQEDTLDFKCPSCGGQGGEWEGDDDGFIDYNDPDYFTSCWDCKGTGYLEPMHHPGQDNQGAVGATVFDIRDEQHRQEYDVENAMPFGNMAVQHGEGEILDPKRMGFSRDGRMKQTAHPLAPQKTIASTHPALRHRLPTVYTREWDGRPTNRGLNITGHGGSDFKRGEPMNIAMRLLKMPFHGTTEDAIEGGRFFGGIKRRGLQPKSPGDGHAKNVFFTDSPIDAATYAKRGANQQNSRPVLIEFPENDVPTESQQSPFFAGDYRTTNQTIPSTNFQYHYGPQREGGMTDEQYNQQMNQWMRQMNKLQVQQPQVQQPQVQQPQVQQPQMIQAGEPMEIAMRLLKGEPADYSDTYHRVRNNIGADGEYITDEELNAIDERYSELHDDESHLEEYYNLLEAIELEKKRRAEESFDGIGLNEETGFTRSEPMEIAMQLLKERVSPEAKRHKLEYDKKYESSPERVKYREELNRERRRRHIMGQGGPDMSHTSQHTIVPEDPHTNRARHFKEKGTLL